MKVSDTAVKDKDGKTWVDRMFEENPGMHIRRNTCKEIKMKIKIKLLNSKAKIPTRATNMAAGLDLYSSHDFVVFARRATEIDCGIAIQLPPGSYGSIKGRSGLAFRRHVVAFEGCIDADFRGEVKVLLYNFSDKPLYGSAGDRVAQMTILPVPEIKLEMTEELDDTYRGTGGFGSTGA